DVALDPLDHHVCSRRQRAVVEAPCLEHVPPISDLVGYFTFNIRLNGFRHTSDVTLEYVALVVHVACRRRSPPALHEVCRGEGDDGTDHDSNTERRDASQPATSRE